MCSECDRCRARWSQPQCGRRGSMNSSADRDSHRAEPLPSDADVEHGGIRAQDFGSPRPPRLRGGRDRDTDDGEVARVRTGGSFVFTLSPDEYDVIKTSSTAVSTRSCGPRRRAPFIISKLGGGRSDRRGAGGVHFVGKEREHFTPRSSASPRGQVRSVLTEPSRRLCKGIRTERSRLSADGWTSRSRHRRNPYQLTERIALLRVLYDRCRRLNFAAEAVERARRRAGEARHSPVRRRAATSRSSTPQRSTTGRRLR